METRSAVYAQTAKKAVETQTLCTLTPSSHTQHAQTEKKEPGNVFSSSAQPSSSSTNTIEDFRLTSNAQETHKSEIQHTHRANSSHFCILQKQSHQHIRVCYCIAHTQHTTHTTAPHTAQSHTHNIHSSTAGLAATAAAETLMDTQKAPLHLAHIHSEDTLQNNLTLALSLLHRSYTHRAHTDSADAERSPISSISVIVGLDLVAIPSIVGVIQGIHLLTDTRRGLHTHTHTATASILPLTIFLLRYFPFLFRHPTQRLLIRCLSLSYIFLKTHRRRTDSSPHHPLIQNVCPLFLFLNALMHSHTLPHLSCIVVSLSLHTPALSSHRTHAQCSLWLLSLHCHICALFPSPLFYLTRLVFVFSELFGCSADSASSCRTASSLARCITPTRSMDAVFSVLACAEFTHKKSNKINQL